MEGLMFPKPVREKKEPKGLARKTPLRAKKQYQYKPKKKKPTESIMQTNQTYCYLCGKPNRRDRTLFNGLEEHHIWEGTSNREQSEKYGLKVYLCGVTCHREGKKSAHKDIEVRDRLRREAQRKFEEQCGTRDEFMEIFGQNLL